MTKVEVPDAGRDRAGGYKVDVTRGERIGRHSTRRRLHSMRRWRRQCPSTSFPSQSGAAARPSWRPAGRRGSNLGDGGGESPGRYAQERRNPSAL
jgi:hypothetical protein